MKKINHAVRLIAAAALLCPVEATIAGPPLQFRTVISQWHYPDMNSVSWNRYFDDALDIVVTHLKSNDTEVAMNLVNRDAFVARLVLLRLLRDPETAEMATRFAGYFQSNSSSELEEPLLRFYTSLPNEKRSAFLDQVEAASEAEFLLGHDGPHTGRAALIFQDLEGTREFFRVQGFADGEAYCLRTIGDGQFRQRSEPAQQIADNLSRALSISESTQNSRGEILSLVSLGRVDQAKRQEYRAKALERARTSRDSFMTYSLLEMGERRDLWPSIESQPGLRWTKYMHFMSNTTDVRTLEAMLAEETDPVLAVQVGMSLFIRHSAAGTDQEAGRAFDRAVQLATQLGYDASAYGTDNTYPATPQLLRLRALLELNLSHYSQAEKFLLTALDSLEKDGRPWISSAAFRQVLLNDLGSLYALRGDLPQSLETIRAALKIAEQIDPEAGTSRALLSLAVVHAQLGELLLAEKELREASRIPTPGRINLALLALAEIHLQFGRYTDAIKDLEDMEPEFSGRMDPKAQAPAYGARLRLLTLSWLRLGDLNRAEKLAREFESLFGIAAPEFPGTPWLSERGLLGLVWIEKKMYPEAERYFRDRLDRRSPLIQKEVQEANALKGLGRVRRLQGHRAEAMALLSQALAKYHTAVQTRDEMEVRLELGHLALASSSDADAQEHFAEALRIAVQTQSPQGVWSAQEGMAKLAKAEGNNGEAIAHLESAVAAVEAVSTRLTFDLVKSTFVEDKVDLYDDLIRLLISRGEFEKAFEYAQRRRSQSFAESIRMQGGAPSVETQSSGLLSEMTAVRGRLVGKQKAIAEQMSSPKRDIGLVASLDSELAGIRSENDDLRRRLDQEDPMEAWRQGVAHPLTVTEIQRDVLKTGDLLVDYLVTSDEIFAFAITPASFNVIPLRIRRETLAKSIQELRRPFDRMGAGDTELLHMDKYDVDLSHRLYLDLVDPVIRAAKESKRLIIVPDDVLHYLPFESLAASKPLPRATTPDIKYAEYRDVNWLMRSHTILYAVSVDTLRLTPNDSDAPKTLLAIGNPKLGNQVAGSSAMPQLPSIPGSATEAAAVARALEKKGIAPTVLIGAAALESEFARDAPKAGYIHFAGHGLLNDKQPYYSALMLSPDSENDGWLQTYEITTMRLKARLVTLSGCDTGLGRLYKGEGVLGLRRAFLIAGAQSVVVSLWSVEDSAPGLMENFYDNIARGQSIDAALRTAKVQQLDRTMKWGGTEISLSHPFFWAPFTLASTSVH